MLLLGYLSDNYKTMDMKPPFFCHMPRYENGPDLFVFRDCIHLSVWDAAQQIPVDLRTINIREALKTASQFSIYAYDAYFLTCAASLNSPLMTLDRGMIEVAQRLGIHVMEVT